MKYWRSILAGLLLGGVCLGQPNTDQATSMFELQSGFWVNLHHYLYQQAMSDSDVEIAPRGLRGAISYYRTAVASWDLLDTESARINLRLSTAEGLPRLIGSDLPSDLADALNNAASVYRDSLWAQHDRANKAWMSAVAPLLRQHESPIRAKLEQVFATQWSGTPIRVDVVNYANWAGAYTSLGPTHVTIASVNPAYQGDAALEMLFHEASHALVGKVRNALAAEARSQGKLFRRGDLWHAIIFFTAGEAILGNIPGYSPYAVKNGLYTGGWDGLFQILSADWRPYLRGEVDLESSAKRLVDSFGVKSQ